MRTPFLRLLWVLSISAALIACSGASGSTTPSQAAVSPTATTAPLTAAPASPTATPRQVQELGRSGILAPGTYRFSQHDPTLTFELPTGWIVTDLMPRHFGLRSTELAAANSVTVWYDMRAASRDPSCPEAPDPEAGHAGDQLIYALRRRPGIVPTQTVPITLGGLDGYWSDLRIDQAWTEPCPFTDGVPATTLFTDDLDPDDPAFWGLAGYDERMRVLVLDDGAGSNVVVAIDAVDAPTFEALVAAAMPVIDTFRFE